jgi:uncharacterized protein YukE
MSQFLADGNWAAVDQPGNPVPGNPQEIAFLASQLLDKSGQAWSHSGELTALSNSNADTMQGDYAASFESLLADLPARAGALSQGYGLCAQALTTFADQLSTIQWRAAEALDQGTQADAEYRAALEDFSSSVPVPEDLGGIWRGLNQETAQQMAQPLAEEYAAEAENPQEYQAVMDWAAEVGQYAGTAEGNRQAAIETINGCVTDHQDATGQCTSSIQKAMSSLPQAGSASPPDPGLAGTGNWTGPGSVLKGLQG